MLCNQSFARSIRQIFPCAIALGILQLSWGSQEENWRAVHVTEEMGRADLIRVAKLLESGNLEVRFRKGSYSFPDVLTIGSNSRILGEEGVWLHFPHEVSRSAILRDNHQGQGIIVGGDNVSIIGVGIDGGGINGGICAAGIENLNILNCLISNCGSRQALLLIDVSDFDIENNTITDASHGVQIWMCHDGEVSKNIVSGIDGGGIWQASSHCVDYSENVIADCGDVGLDMEGGGNCIAKGNFVTRCKNAELAIFADQLRLLDPMQNLLYVENIAVREPFYRSRQGVKISCSSNTGVITIFSLSALENRAIEFERNILVSGFGYLVYQHEIEPSIKTGLTFRGNLGFTYGSASILRFLEGGGTAVIGNCFIAAGSDGERPNEIKNCANFTFEENLVAYLHERRDTPFLFQNSSRKGVFPLNIKGNRFLGVSSEIVRGSGLPKKREYRAH